MLHCLLQDSPNNWIRSGHAVIIYNTHVAGQEDRGGAQVDVILSRLFATLEFRVDIQHNLSSTVGLE